MTILKPLRIAFMVCATAALALAAGPIAVVNRDVFMPKIPAGADGVKRLRDGTLAELIIGTIVIGIVSVLGVLSPG